LKKIVGIELFAGAGGLSLGASEAGIKVAYAVENSTSIAETYRLNHPKTLLINADVRSIDPVQLVFPDGPKLLFGGPPCQGFSTSNQRNRDKANPKNWYFLEFIRFVRELQPEYVLFENVAGIIQTESGYFTQALRAELLALNYHVSDALLNADDYGVPQRRTRFFCIGSKTSKVVISAPKKALRKISVRNAISDLPTLSVGNTKDNLRYQKRATSKYAQIMRGNLKTCTGHEVTENAKHIVERYRHIPQGGNWRNIPLELMESYADVNRCHTGIYKRLDPNVPSIVLGNFRKNMLIHPWEDRGLSVREAARLQSFPDWYEFRGSIGNKQQQVGNAVPPILAKAVVTMIVDHWKAA
jgi:DNA (cytosine-5)-methyltransferase 1